MKKIDLGKIPDESLVRVRLTTKNSSVALSKNEIRARTGIPTPSLNKILMFYVTKGDLISIETSNGRFYKWVSG